MKTKKKSQKQERMPPKKVVQTGGASDKQTGKAVRLRKEFPKGTNERKELNKIVHAEDPDNAAKYGEHGEYSTAAKKVLDDAEKKAKK